MARGMRFLRVAVVTAALAAFVGTTQASAAQGTLEASVIECAMLDGELVATVGVSVIGAPPSAPIWLRVFYPLQTVPPTPFSVGTTDATGSLTYRFAVGPESAFPLGVSAYITDAEKIDPEAQIGSAVLVEFVCPVLSPQDAIDTAVESGTLTEREATPLAVKLGAVATQEANGNTQAAINLLQAAKQQLDALVRSGRLTTAAAERLMTAIDQEIVRLGGAQ